MNRRELDRKGQHSPSGRLNNDARHLSPGASHLSDDALLDRLYGLGGNDSLASDDSRVSDDSHLHSCQECTERWNAMLERRSQSVSEVAVPNEFLWAQRRKIYARMGEESPSPLRWVPAFAAAALLAIGVLVYHPATPAPQQIDSNDAQLFSEAYSMEQSSEPRAAAPIHALFEDNQNQ